MKPEKDKFIGVYENVFDVDFCQKVITYFKEMETAGFVFSRQQIDKVVKTEKQDEAVFAHSEQMLSIGHTTNILKHINDGLWGVAYKDYADTYSIIRSSDSHSSYTAKIQKTVVGGGYHSWHYESSSRETCNFLLAWMVYLNDVEEGGETEFLYLAKRIKPKQGTLVIWPAAFTHTHRGNPPLSNEKYIVTGCIEF
jgi:hypothetical protein